MIEQQIPQANILGVKVSAINMAQALNLLANWIRQDQKRYVVVCPVYNIMMAQQNTRYHSILNEADLITPDGMPLVWLCKWMGHREVTRVYGPDLMLAMTQISAQSGFRNYYFGGAEGVADQLAGVMQAKYPELQVAGTYSPPFSEITPAEDSAIIKRINEAQPDIVWIGLGSPKQDIWMAEHRAKLNAPLLIGVGAAFDFHTGRIRQAPRWIQRTGLEWLFRLMMEPRRLWRRYLIYNPLFVFYILRQLIQTR